MFAIIESNHYAAGVMKRGLAMSVETITIVLANRPRILRELLHHALSTTEVAFQVVEVSDDGQLPAMLDRVAPQWTIIGALPNEETLPTTLATAYPGMGIMAVAPDGSQVSIITNNGNGPLRSDYPDVSLAQLMNLLHRDPHSFR